VWLTHHETRDLWSLGDVIVPVATLHSVGEKVAFLVVPGTNIVVFLVGGGDSLSAFRDGPGPRNPSDARTHRVVLNTVSPSNVSHKTVMLHAPATRTFNLWGSGYNIMLRSSELGGMC
jgi:hypothetical protein